MIYCCVFLLLLLFSISLSLSISPSPSRSLSLLLALFLSFSLSLKFHSESLTIGSIVIIISAAPFRFLSFISIRYIDWARKRNELSSLKKFQNNFIKDTFYLKKVMIFAWQFIGKWIKRCSISVESVECCGNVQTIEFNVYGGLYFVAKWFRYIQVVAKSMNW